MLFGTDGLVEPPLGGDRRADAWDMSAHWNDGYIRAEDKAFITCFLDDRIGEKNLDLAAGWYEHAPGSTVIDLSYQSLIQNPARDKVLFDFNLISNGAHLPFRNDSFDSATLILGWAYLEDPSKFLRELERVLRPGAELMIVNETEAYDRNLAKRATYRDEIADEVREAGYDCLIESLPTFESDVHCITVAMPSGFELLEGTSLRSEIKNKEAREERGRKQSVDSSDYYAAYAKKTSSSCTSRVFKT